MEFWERYVVKHMLTFFVLLIFYLGWRRFSVLHIPGLSSDITRWWIHAHCRSYIVKRRWRGRSWLWLSKFYIEVIILIIQRTLIRLHGISFCSIRAISRWWASEKRRHWIGKVLWDRKVLCYSVVGRTNKSIVWNCLHCFVGNQRWNWR